MGKKKNKKFGAPKPQPTGLPSVNGDETELMNNGPPTVVTDVLDQVRRTFVRRLFYIICVGD